MHRFVPHLAGFALAAVAPLTATAQTQTVAPAAPTIGASGGVGGGIALPVGKLLDTHQAGYVLAGLIDFSAAEQPYSFRVELIYQHYDRQSTAPVGTPNKNITSLGGSLLARRPRGASSTFVIGGIAVYRSSGDGTKPGVNAGLGLDVPLTFFVGTADIRVHLVLTEKKPLVTIPVTLGARF